jgi:hypothetical protein
MLSTYIYSLSRSSSGVRDSPIVRVTGSSSVSNELDWLDQERRNELLAWLEPFFTKTKVAIDCPGEERPPRNPLGFAKDQAAYENYDQLNRDVADDATPTAVSQSDCRVWVGTGLAALRQKR